MSRTFTTLTLVSVLASCARPAPAPTEPPAPQAPAEDTGAEPPSAEVDFSGWEGWSKVNADRKQSEGHNNAWVDVYVAAEHVDAYKAGTPAAVGTRVVKAQYDGADATAPNRLTVMAKRDPGYDPDNGDWYYGVFAPDGAAAKMQGKLGQCSGCHASASDRDFLFGMP